ncbi:CoA transferase [Janibacter sp. GS2]|uniref:CoA transferase n=1 Tax=Janibacter sp. GS2 TaxID=3442646 RepID=UPI003EBAE96A
MTLPAEATGGLPLDGVRVLELSSYVATPLCGLTLAQLGADVIRVEPPGGAPDRTRLPMADGGTSYYWTGLNKGKRAIAVDLSTDQGREVVSDLATAADVVIANAPYSGAVTAQALRERNPALVHIRLSGTWTGAPSVDYLAQARAGFPQVTGPQGHAVPVNHVLPAWDVAAGLYLATGVLAALHGRRETGRGSGITLALEDVALATAGNLGVLSQAQFERVGRAADGNHVYGTYGRDFELADGHRIMLVVLTTRHWHCVLEVAGLGEAVAGLERALDIDLDDEQVRYAHREVISALLEPWFRRQDLEGLTAALDGRRILWSAYRTFDEAAEHLGENPLFAEVDQPGIGRHLAPGSPLVFDEQRRAPQRAPRVGEHTDDVLAEHRDEAHDTAQVQSRIRDSPDTNRRTA